jgi:hypothetical protein
VTKVRSKDDVLLSLSLSSQEKRKHYTTHTHIYTTARKQCILFYSSIFFPKPLTIQMSKNEETTITPTTTTTTTTTPSTTATTTTTIQESINLESEEITHKKVMSAEGMHKVFCLYFLSVLTSHSPTLFFHTPDYMIGGKGM